MFGKKKQPENIKLPPSPPPVSNEIKQNIGDVSNSGMRDVGASIEPPPPPPLARPPLEVSPQYIDDIPKQLPKPAKQLPAAGYQRRPHPSHAKKPSPPLFIKIDKYRELVQGIKDLRSHALSLRDALDAITDIEKELRNGISITQNSLDRFNSVITSIDTRLLRVGAEEEVIEVPKEMDDYVKDLYDHVERIKHDLKVIKED